MNRHSPEKCKDGGKHIWRKNDPGFLLTNCNEKGETISFQGICKRCGCEDMFVPWVEYSSKDDNRENIEVYPHELRMAREAAALEPESPPQAEGEQS